MKNFEEFVTSASPPPIQPHVHRYTRSLKNTKAGFIFFISIFFLQTRARGRRRNKHFELCIKVKWWRKQAVIKGISSKYLQIKRKQLKIKFLSAYMQIMGRLSSGKPSLTEIVKDLKFTNLLFVSIIYWRYKSPDN